MTKKEFETLAQNLIILDGATGSNLIRAGMPRGVSTERWVLEHPQILMDLQRAYIEAGSQIICAPTFGANRMAMAGRGDRESVASLNKKLVAISQEAAEGRAYIAGDLSTGGKILGASEEATYEEALERYKEQMSALAEAGVDLFLVETMISIDETVAALEAAQQVSDLPVLCSVTVEADGSIFSGGNAVAAMETLQELGASAVGVNCSVGPDQLEAIVTNMKEIARVPVIAKPNAGMPQITETGEAIYSMDARMFAKHMETLVRAGAGIVGGCCGTSPEYIREMCRILQGEMV